MGPKKSSKGAKKEEVNPEPPKASTLPDGECSHWIGGWSSFDSLGCLQALTDPSLKENACNFVRVMPGTIEEVNVAPVVPAAPSDGAATADDEKPAAPEVDPTAPKKIVVGTVEIVGQLAATSAANKSAWEEKRAPKAAAAEGEDGDDAAGDAADDEAPADADGDENGEENAPQAGSRPAQLYYDESILFKGNLLLEGAKPPVEINIELPEKKAAPVVTKGKKKADEEAQRAKEAEAQREREEAARKAAEEEAERLSQFAAPSKFPAVSFTNIAFQGRLHIKDAHVTFTNCHFCCGEDHQVIVNPYCKVKFSKCTFSNIPRTGIYAFPLTEVTIENCAFTGIYQPETEEQITQVASIPKFKKEFDAKVASAQLNTNSVGIYADDAVLNVSNSIFSHLTTGMVLSGKCTGATVQHNFFENLFSIGLYCDGTAATILSNNIDACGYYGMQFVGRCSGKVMFNTVASTVQVAAGAHPLLHTNTLAVKLVDMNDVGTISMQPTY